MMQEVTNEGEGGNDAKQSARREPELIKIRAKARGAIDKV